ncbi:hypothetical protein FFLO_02094 [Filobasidium floriforme]|uniref:Integrase catalytic domain-containing protein n=1 Tax=Filobasidium floriforme TaxID=5210 RepID=A0A8K0JND5_9TREE|nr:hypothetical protein FFLO_02094 [Filobasidium floriforme]
MDDFFSSCNDFSKGIQQLEALLKRAISHKVRFSPKKTKLFVSKTTLGGQVISQAGVEPDKEKVAAILELPVPTTALGLLSFINKCGYFRPMIKDFSLIAAPLLELLRDLKVENRQGRGKLKRALEEKDIVTEMEKPERLEAFDRLKKILSEYPIVHPPVYGEPFEVAVDACARGFGANLFQTRGGKVCTIAYASKIATPTESLKHSFKLELAGAKWALDKFRPLIFGQPIILHTDCSAVRGLLNNDKPSFEQVAWKEAIFQSTIIEYRHKPGRQNVVADYLSRNPTQEGPEITSHADTKGVEVRWIDKDGNEALRKRFQGDPYYPIVMFLSKLIDAEADVVKRKAKDFWLEDGQLWTKNRVTLKPLKVLTCKEGSVRARVAHQECGHWGMKKSRSYIEQSETWSSITKDLRNAIETCSTCMGFGPKTRNALLWETARYAPFELVAADYLSLPNSEEGHRVALIAVDVFTKFIWGWTFKRPASGETTIEALEDLRNRYMLPSELVCDNGSHFINAKVKSYLGEKCAIVPSAPYAHVGLAENANHLVLERLRRLVQTPIEGLDPASATRDESFRSWPNWFQKAITALNDRKMNLLGGYSPREVLFGKTDDRPIPVDMAEAVNDGVHLRREAVEARDEDIERRGKPNRGARMFEVGQLVQRYDESRDATHDTSKKLRMKWTGPYRITELSRSSAYLATPDGEQVGRVGFDRLRAWKGAWRGIEEGDRMDGNGD